MNWKKQRNKQQYAKDEQGICGREERSSGSAF